MSTARWHTFPPDLLVRLARYARRTPRCVQRREYHRKRLEEAEQRRAAIPPLCAPSLAHSPDERPQTPREGFPESAGSREGIDRDAPATSPTPQV